MMTVAQAFQLAMQHHQAGRLTEAGRIYQQIVAVEPNHADALHLLGVIALEFGRSDAAVELFRRVCALLPNHPEVRSNLAESYRRLGRREEAVAEFRRAIELQPELADLHCNLGNALSDLGRLDEASASYHRALELQPGLADAHNNLGHVLKELGRLPEGLQAFARAMELQPAVAAVHSNLVYATLFDPRADAQTLQAQCAEWDRRHAAPLRKDLRPHANNRDPERRLKIGYVSPDFGSHVVGHFLTPLLEAHDHAAFEIYCYASAKRADAITARQRQRVDVWRDVLGCRDEDLAGLIRADAIDILIDLSQHMAHHQLLVFARKPAPVQVSWLGYPGSTGLATIDYRLTDRWMEPEGAPRSEPGGTAVRLPDSWFCFDPLDEFPEPGELPALRAGHVTFGSLNNFCKINEAVLARWARVLHAVGGSRLLLQCPRGATWERVWQYFVGCGIGAERVELVARTASREEFLGLFARIDIALDPFPYNGGTTTCEALWMGIPVLTLPGEVIVSRIGLSILSAVGVPELVTHSEEDYVRLAVELAGDLPRLAAYRTKLRGQMKNSCFMDGPRFARHMEAAYRAMWRQWCVRPLTTPAALA